MRSHRFISKLLLALTFICSTIAFHAQSEEFAHAQLFSLTTQTPSSGKGVLVKMETVDYLSNIELSPTKDLLTIKKDAVYMISIITQIGATTPGTNGYVDFWVVKNGKPIPNFNNRQSVVTSNYASTVATSYVVALASGDTVGTMLSASGPSLGLIYIRPHGEPAIPSMNFAISQLSPISRAANVPTTP